MTSDQLTLATIHAAGGEVAGPHGDAWIRLPDRATILDRVRALRARLGRLVLPSDLTGRPLPILTGGDDLAAKDPTPGSVAQAGKRTLTADELTLVRQAMAGHTIKTAATVLAMSEQTLRRALRGDQLMPDTCDRLMTRVRELTNPKTTTTDEEPMPATDPTDSLFARLEQAMDDKKNPKRMAAALGMSPTAWYGWRKKGAIPADRREAVERWLAAPDTAPVEPKPRAPRPTKTATNPETTAATQDASGTFLAALRGIARAVYLIEDGRLVERMAVVL